MCIAIAARADFRVTGSRTSMNPPVMAPFFDAAVALLPRPLPPKLAALASLYPLFPRVYDTVNADNAARQRSTHRNM